MTEYRTNTKHSPVRDDALKSETETLAHGGDSRAEEWRRPEEERDDPEQPIAAPSNDPHANGGTPPGMTPEDVRGRSELARWLQPAAFPTDRRGLLHSTKDTSAPDWVVEAIRSLPAGQRYENTQAVWRTLGGGTEDVEHRS